MTIDQCLAHHPSSLIYQRQTSAGILVILVLRTKQSIPEFHHAFFKASPNLRT
jgi:hypothetical protein